MNNFFQTHADEQEVSHWLPISDLMAGLMIVFLFVSISLMRSAYMERDQIREIAVAYQDNQLSIYHALNKEFEKELGKWDADIDEETLTFTFKSPDVLFEVGKIELSDDYKKLLKDFFPRYMAALQPYYGSISEVRIEGHTSSGWNRYVSPEAAYFNNMALSQGRTRAVLDYVYQLESSSPYREWIKSHIAAVGLSSSKLIRAPSGGEDSAASRRVSFRVITNADIQIQRIIEGS